MIAISEESEDVRCRRSRLLRKMIQQQHSVMFTPNLGHVKDKSIPFVFLEMCSKNRFMYELHQLNISFTKRNQLRKKYFVYSQQQNAKFS